MPRRGSKTVLDVEDAFAFWYDAGGDRRRTYGEVAQSFGVSYRTVQRAAFNNDWLGRAEHLDREAHAVADTKLAARRAEVMIRAGESALAELERFARRLPDALKDGSGALIANPYRLSPGELSMTDVLRAAQLLEAAGVIGIDSDQKAADEQHEQLEELRREVAEMYEHEDLSAEAEAGMTSASPDR